MEQNYQNCFCSISTPDGVSVANKITAVKFLQKKRKIKPNFLKI
jgi:hypothetical protein